MFKHSGGEDSILTRQRSEKSNMKLAYVSYVYQHADRRCVTNGQLETLEVCRTESWKQPLVDHSSYVTAGGCVVQISAAKSKLVVQTTNHFSVKSPRRSTAALSVVLTLTYLTLCPQHKPHYLRHYRWHSYLEYVYFLFPFQTRLSFFFF